MDFDGIHGDEHARENHVKVAAGSNSIAGIPVLALALVDDARASSEK
jgi:hypothetical protein